MAKILITGNSMVHLTGQPLYCYSLGIELSKQHDVVIVSDFENKKNDKNIDTMKINLMDSGVKCLQFGEKAGNHYDFAFLSERCSLDLLQNINSDRIINVIHSEFDCEAPILDGRVYKYVAIRESIKNHLVDKYCINENKINVIYNGVDRSRFSMDKRKKPNNKFKKIVIPCTIDKLRERFLNHAIGMANEGLKIFIYGENFGGKIGKIKKHFPDLLYRIIPPGWLLGDNVYLFDHVFDIENYICDADEVWGIKMGRINLEANSMGIPSVIFDPFELTSSKFSVDENEFDDKFNIKNVANRLMSL